MPNSANVAPEPRILRGIIDQDGIRWIIYGSSRCSVSCSLQELSTSADKVFDRLSQVGKTVLTRKSKERFLQEVEAFNAYESGLVVSRLGWTKDMFLNGDGTLIQSLYDGRRPIVVCDANLKFFRSGTLENWQTKIGAVVKGQPLPLFLFNYAFVGAILEYAPVDVQNTVVELVGERYTGKSTLVAATGSVWGGNPDTATGFAESWDLTSIKIDPLAECHRGSLLILDEANLVADRPREQARFMQAALFKMTNTGSRQRFTDPAPASHTRIAYLSSSNTSVADLIGGKSADRRAALSRILTVTANRQFGVLDSIPWGFSTAQAAIEELSRVCAAEFGVAGPTFVKGLLDRFKTEVDMKAEIQRSYQKSLDHPVISCFDNPRLRKILAITCVAHEIATCLGVVPANWGSITQAINALTSDSFVVGLGYQKDSACDRLRDYVHQNQHSFTEDHRLRQPLSASQFDSTPGIWSRGRQLLLIPAAAFRRAFPDDHCQMLREIRASGGLEHEGGTSPKNSKKVPSGVCVDHGRRAYFFRAPAFCRTLKA